MSQRPVIWISRRSLILIALVVLAILAAFVWLPRANGGDDALLEPAKRVAQGLGTLDIYLNSDAYKSDLTWSAYQQLLAVAPQYRAPSTRAQENAQAPYRAALVKYGAVIVLDQDVFGENTATVLIQTFLKNPSGATTLQEFQLQMVPDGATWKVNNVTTLNKGEVKSK